MLTTSAAIRCLLRCRCLNAATSTRAMQQIGLLYALEPGIFALHPPGPGRSAALLRHAAHSNTHPYLAPLYLGIVLSLERQVAEGALPEEAVRGIGGTLSTTLSAIGDVFFEGALIPFWALLCIGLVLAGWPMGAVAVTAFFFLCMLVLHTLVFFYGLRHGVAALGRLRNLSLVSQAWRLKCVNAVMLMAVLALMPWEASAASCFSCAPAVLLAAAAGAGNRNVPRVLVWAVALFSMSIFDLPLLDIMADVEPF